MLMTRVLTSTRTLFHKTTADITTLKAFRCIFRRNARSMFPNKNDFRSYASEAKSYDPYQVLNVDPGASLKEIRNAYIKLSKQYHPDYNPGDEEAEEKFISMTNAYRTLVERVVNEQTEDTNGEQKIEKEYDFTISPLGIETEPSDVLTLHDIKRRILLLFAAAFILTFAKMAWGDMLVDFVKGLFSADSGKSEKQLEEEAAERIRKAIIEKHRNEETLRKMYENSAVRR